MTALVADVDPAALSAGRAHKPATQSLKGLQRPREELALPERCGVCMHKIVPIQSCISNALTLFRILSHRTMSPAIAHVGDGFCQLLGLSPEAAASGIRTPSPRLTNMGLSGSADNASTNVFWDQQNLPCTPVFLY